MPARQCLQRGLAAALTAHTLVGRCHGLGEVVSYNCSAGYARRAVEWSHEKAAWCCEYLGYGCSVASAAAVAQSAAASSSEGGGAASTAEQAEANAAAAVAAALANASQSSSQAAFAASVSSLSFDCKVGHEHWKQTWSSRKQKYCCQVAGYGCSSVSASPTTSFAFTSPPYDCQLGLQNWKLGWSAAKKEWCCAALGFGCPTDDVYGPKMTSAEMASASPSSALSRKFAPKWTTMTTTSLRSTGTLAAPTAGYTGPLVQPPPLYNCTFGIEISESQWSHAQKEWCCDHTGRGCLNRALMPDLAHAAVPYDCQAGVSSWRTSWHKEKKTWCCTFKHVGCSPAAVERETFVTRIMHSFADRIRSVSHTGQAVIAAASVAYGAALLLGGFGFWPYLISCGGAVVSTGLAYHEAAAWNMAFASHVAFALLAGTVAAIAMYIAFEISQLLLGIVTGLTLGAVLVAVLVPPLEGLPAYFYIALPIYSVGAVVGIALFSVFRKPCLATWTPVAGGVLLLSGLAAVLAQSVARASAAANANVHTLMLGPAGFLPSANDPWLDVAADLIGRGGLSELALMFLVPVVATILHGLAGRRDITVLTLSLCMAVVFASDLWQRPEERRPWPLCGRALWVTMAAMACWRQLGQLRPEDWMANKFWQSIVSSDRQSKLWTAGLGSIRHDYEGLTLAPAREGSAGRRAFSVPSGGGFGWGCGGPPGSQNYSVVRGDESGSSHFQTQYPTAWTG